MVDMSSETDEYNFLAGRIARAISESGKTGAQIACDSGVSEAAVSKWKKDGKIGAFNLFRLSQSTNKPLDWFFPGFREPGHADDPRDDLSQLLESKADDSQFLESALLSVLLAKQRASSRS